MWTAISLFFNKNAVRVMGVVAAILAFLGAVLAVFSAGKKAERVNELEREVESGRKANAVKNENSALSDSAIDDKLRDDWGR